MKEFRKPVAMVPHHRAIREWILTVVLLSAGCLILIAAGYRQYIAKNAPGGYSKTGTAPELEVTFLDVGQGDSIFIRTPSGRVVLVDAGPGKGEYSRFDAGERVVVPFLKRMGIRKIDTLVMTHPHADHYGGMFALLGKFEIGEFLDPGQPYPSELYESLLDKLDQLGIPYRLTRAPSTLDWDPSMLVQVLWPEEGHLENANPNNVSIVLRIVHGNNVYLLTGDIEMEIEMQLNAYQTGLRSTVLKIPHHGSTTSSSQRFLEYVRPRFAVMQLGINNRFGFPERAITERYRSLEIPVHRTDLTGTARTFSDGNRIKVQPEKGTPFTIHPFPSEPPEATP